MKRVTPFFVVMCVLLAAMGAWALQRANVKPARQPAADGQRSWWGPPPDQRPDEGPTARGDVQAVGASSITLRTPCGFNTYSVTAETQIIVRGQPGTLADIKVGDQAAVNFDFLPDVTTKARRIRVMQPQAAGQITAIQGNVVTITGRPNVAWTVNVAPETRIVCRQIRFTLADLRIGYRAVAEGEVDGNNVQARVIRFEPPTVRGAVTQVSDNSIQVKTIEQRLVNGVLTERTGVMIRPRVGPDYPGTRADIKQGMACNMGGHVTQGQPMEVLFVELLIGQ